MYKLFFVLRINNIWNSLSNKARTSKTLIKLKFDLQVWFTKCNTAINKQGHNYISHKVKSHNCLAVWSPKSHNYHVKDMKLPILRWAICSHIHVAYYDKQEIWLQILFLENFYDRVNKLRLVRITTVPCICYCLFLFVVKKFHVYLLTDK